MNIIEQIAKRIVQLRKDKGMTAETLAWTAKLSKSCVSYAEQGKHDIKISTISAICNALGVSLSDFFKDFN